MELEYGHMYLLSQAVRRHSFSQTPEVVSRLGKVKEGIENYFGFIPEEVRRIIRTMVDDLFTKEFIESRRWEEREAFRKIVMQVMDAMEGEVYSAILGSQIKEQRPEIHLSASPAKRDEPQIGDDLENAIPESATQPNAPAAGRVF